MGDEDDDWGDDDDGWGDDDGGEEWDQGDEMELDDFDFGQQNEEIDPLENKFHEAVAIRMVEPEQSLEMFKEFLEGVKAGEGKSSAEYVLKALTYSVEICFKLNKVGESQFLYKELLNSLNEVTPNERKDAIETVLDQINLSVNPGGEQLYIDTIEALAEDEVLQFTVSMKLCRLHAETLSWGKVNGLLDTMHESCRINGEDDPSKAGPLLQIYAIKIEEAFYKNDRDALDVIFNRTQKLQAAVNDHRSLPIVKEFYGKYYAEARNWQDSCANFFDALKYFQNIDSDRAKACVRYLVLVTMLSAENTDPFGSREAKIFEESRDVVPVAKLYEHFCDNDIHKYNENIRKNPAIFEKDIFIKGLMDPLKNKLLRKTTVSLLVPYNRVHLSWLSKKLYLNTEETEQLLVAMILDESIHARINQVESTLEIRKPKSKAILNSLKSWSSALQSRQSDLLMNINRIASQNSMRMGGFGGESYPAVSLIPGFI